MTLPELLDRIRALYVAELIRSLAETADAVGEVVLRRGTGAIGPEGTLDLGMRIDVSVVAAGSRDRQLHVTSGRRMQFEPLSVDIQGVDVELHPFAWDDLTLRVLGGSGDLIPLVQWFERWFGGDATPGEDGLRGVVHFMSDPTPVEGGRRFEIDLGSAPIVAFVDLVEACIATGATRVLVEAA